MSFFKSIKRFFLLVALIVFAQIAFVLVLPEQFERVTDQSTVSDRLETIPREKTFPARKPARSPADAERRRRPIAVIIDDIGYNLHLVEEMVRIEAPLTFAILPHTPHAVEAARLLHGAGKEILLHIPMEPRSYPAENPGVGALFTHMSDEEVRRRSEADLAAVPYISGVNNHMGSRFMEDEAKLYIVMQELAKRGLFFVDSRTTPDSRGRAATARAGVRFLERALFIDDQPGYAATLANLIHPPRKEGEGLRPLILIGHPSAGTVRALKHASSLWQNEGVRVIPISECFNLPNGKEKTGTLVTKW